MDTARFARVFKALGDETRVRMVGLLSHGELCVCHLEKLLGLRQPTASRHLAVLRHAGLVDARRVGTWVHYRLVPQDDRQIQRILDELTREFAENKRLRRELAQLLKRANPASCP